MEIEIVESPIRFRLHGVGGAVEGRRYAEVGLRLMNETWRAVKGAGLPTTGIKHRGSPDGGKEAIRRAVASTNEAVATSSSP